MKKILPVIKLVACVSAQDGIISSDELETAYRLINEKIGKIDKKSFDSCIEEFFNEENTLEDYLGAISKEFSSKTLLNICYQSAISDGLEIRENLAFDKACKFWELDPESIS